MKKHDVNAQTLTVLYPLFVQFFINFFISYTLILLCISAKILKYVDYGYEQVKYISYIIWTPANCISGH